MDVLKYFGREYWLNQYGNEEAEFAVEEVVVDPVIVKVKVVVTPTRKIFFFSGSQSYWDFLQTIEGENNFLFYGEGDNTHNPNIIFNGFDQTLFSGAYELEVEIKENDNDAANSHTIYVISATNIII